MKWADREVKGESPLSMRLGELAVLLDEIKDDSEVRAVVDLVDEFREGLEHMRRQRRDRQTKMVWGSLVSRNPQIISLVDWLTSAPIPESQREWAKQFLSKGETYG